MFYTKHIENVIAEAMRKGARAINIGEAGKIRIFLEPEKEFVSNLKIFISHSSLDKAWAYQVEEELGEVGFQVIVLPMGGEDDDAIVEQKLTNYVEEADYLCMLVTENSLERHWVQYEYKEAIKYMGRVFFLRHESCMRNPLEPTWSPEDSLTPIHFKHSSMTYPKQAKDRCMLIARELINEPDEGWSDGRACPLSIRERDLRKENRAKHYARRKIALMPKFTDREIPEVIPFFWDQIDCEEGDGGSAINWLVLKQGRIPLETQLFRHEVSVSITSIPLNETMSSYFGRREIQAFLIWHESNLGGF